MYHLELRQFPHNLCRFNLAEQQLRAVLVPWVREQPLELGERKWSPHQAKLTVLEGPRLEVQQLSMGRGWRAAQRESEEVTERVIAATLQALGAETAQAPPVPAAQTPLAAGPSALSAHPRGAATDAPALGDPLALGVQLASLLGADPAGLLAAWRQAAASAPDCSPSETLALAEELLRSPGAGSGAGGGR
jgi:hypothetical protein